MPDVVYPKCVYSWGGLSRAHDYLMSDNTIKTLSEREAEDLITQHLDYVSGRKTALCKHGHVNCSDCDQF